MDRATPLSQHTARDSSLSLSIPNTVEDSAPPPASDDGNDDYDEMDDGQYFNDNDSALGGSLIGYDTQTIASYMTDYRYENGRRYHAYRDGEYWVLLSQNVDRASPNSSRDQTMNLRTNNKISHITCTS